MLLVLYGNICLIILFKHRCLISHYQFTTLVQTLMSADDLQVLVKTDHHLTVCLNTFIWLLHNQIHTSINTCITSLGNENSAFRKDGTKSKM